MRLMWWRKGVKDSLFVFILTLNNVWSQCVRCWWTDVQYLSAHHMLSWILAKYWTTFCNIFCTSNIIAMFAIWSLRNEFIDWHHNEWWDAQGKYEPITWCSLLSIVLRAGSNPYFSFIPSHYNTCTHETWFLLLTLKKL